MKDIKIFEGTIKEIFEQSQKEGYRILNVKETYNEKEKRKDENYYLTSIIYYKGKIRKIKKAEMDNPESVNDGGHFIWLGALSDNSNVFGDSRNLYFNNRAFGVKE